MARYPGTETILDATTHWRDACLLAGGSVFTDRELWAAAPLEELSHNFLDRPDEGNRSFMDKLRDQLAPTTVTAKQLAAEMLWVMLLFPNNVGRASKTNTVRTVWGWSGDTLPADHQLLAAFGGGVGSGGTGYNNFRPLEFGFFIRLLQAWVGHDRAERERLLGDPWVFSEFLDGVDGAGRRQLRHMLLHLLFPDTFERVSSGSQKEQIDNAFRSLLPPEQLSPAEVATTLIARDRRIFRVRRRLEAENGAGTVDFYHTPFAQRWHKEAAQPGSLPERPPASNADGASHEEPDGAEPRSDAYTEPALDTITKSIQDIGLRVSDRTVRRYHLALRSRGFVILSGVSGAGKTWLAEAYAQAAGARYLVVPVAPNWTTNEDLLGFTDPFTGKYRDTAFSLFVREAAAEHATARQAGRLPRPYHLVLDEMNLARVEYYFAKFLSAMELRMRAGEARLDLGPHDSVVLAPILRFVGTVNVDETTHGFADKVFDRAQLIEIEAPRDALAEHLGGAPYRDVVLALWDAVAAVAPFAFRVIDDFGLYVGHAKDLGAPWEELVDELVLQKVLPKLRGTDPRVGDALAALDDITREHFPLSNAKVRTIRTRFEQHGVASFF